MFSGDGERDLLLTATLSVRNADPTRPIRLAGVRYVGSAGQTIRSYVEAPQTLGPLATASFVVAESDPAERSNPDIPKAVLAMAPDGRSGRALYFTRSVLYGDAPVWLHHGVYGYRREALERFTAAPPSPLELRERLEQLRALEMGMQVWAAVIDEAPISVDNPADLERARAYARRLDKDSQ